MRLTRRAFEKLVRAALRDIPPAFAEHLKGVSIDIEDWPDSATCRDLDVEDPADLMGLYEGLPITDRSVNDGPMLPDRIILFQGGIESAADTDDEIKREVRTTVLHEIGHHFGLDEDDLEALGFD